MSLDAFVTTFPAGGTGALEYCGGSMFVGAGWKFYGSQGSERLVGPGITDDGISKLQLSGTASITKVLVNGASDPGGGYSAAFFNAIATEGSGAGLQLDDRANTSHKWQHYATNETFRFWNNVNGDSLTIDTNGNFATVGSGVFGGLLSTTLTNSTTNTIDPALSITHNSNSTPAAGFGVAAIYKLQSSTTSNRNAAEVDISWATATDASRKGRMVFGVWDNSALRTAIQIDTNGTNAQITALSSFIEKPISLTFGATVNTDASVGNVFMFTATSSFTLANPTNGSDGQKVLWRIQQDSSGSHNITFGTNFTFGVDILSVTLSTSSNAYDYIGAIYNSTVSKWHVISFARGY